MNEIKNDSAVIRALGQYAENVSTAPDAGVAFRYAEEATRDLIGHRLFTIMQFDPVTMRVKRCYSSNPDDYPPGGHKEKRDTQWGRHVLEQGRYYLGSNAEDIRANFDDHDVIAKLGLESVLNMPIRNLGQTIGTMNLLDVAGYYRQDHVVVASVIAAGLASVLVHLNFRNKC